ncbi:hypothetical protein Patl1_03936 [Pistacia atlantica]|uniref:Uncharacterized protein n=1 Tax=Pistacia atlantica TaxID=434234 RepID=A0ACC1BQV0_9ROSI|nr:hypothetical protein Patl1_03936 [Pistacia atlantica]
MLDLKCHCFCFSQEDETPKSNVNRSPVNDHVETCSTGGSKSSPVWISSVQLEHFNGLELVKPVESYHERSVVEEPKVGDLQGKEKGSDVYSRRITRSQSSSQQTSFKRGSVNVNIDDQTASSSKSRGPIKKKSVLSTESSKSGGEGSLPQSKRRKVNNRLNDSLSASPSLRVGGDVQSSVSYSLVELNQNGDCHMLGESHSSPKLQVSEGELCLDEKNRNVRTPFPSVQEESEVPFISCLADQATGDPKGCSNVEAGETDPNSVLNSSKQCTMGENKVLLQGELCLEERKRSAHTPFTFAIEESEVPFISSLADQGTGDSEGCSNVEAGVSVPISVPDSSKQCTLEENKVLPHLDVKFEPGNIENLTCTERGEQERKSHLEENGEFLYCSAEFKSRKSMELIYADRAIPEFEGFIVQTDNEQSCTEESINFDELNLTKSTIERASLLERLCKSASMHTPLSHFSTTYKLQRAPNLYQSVPNGLLECDLRSNFFTIDDIGKQFKASSFDVDVNNALEGRSYSDCLPFSSVQSAWDIRKPFTSPVGKLWDRTSSSSGSSEKREGIASEVISPVKREPLADITEDPNLPASVSRGEIFAARDSIESVKTDYSFTGTCNRVNQKLEHHNSSKKQLTKKMKVSASIAPGEKGTYRLRESVRNRFSKPKVSGKPSLRKGGPSLAEKETKHNNIVSNLSSFIPLVQRKQPAAIITGKRDVKVKALEAAEAAKRLAQEKENERKMKKEAMKSVRARLEQENLKQVEAQKKKKEEERKKKEAEMAARKRQREEEERKEKDRKRKRLVESFKQQRENEEKLRMKKENEVKGRSIDERANEMKVSKDETGKDNRKEKEMGKPEKASIVPEVCKISTGYGDNTKVMSNVVQKAAEDHNLGTNQYQEESYDISPYKGSDDEDEDEDDIPNTKFIPSWASKNRVAEAIASQQKLNPETIFPRQSFCRVIEVLQPRKKQPHPR